MIDLKVLFVKTITFQKVAKLAHEPESQFSTMGIEPTLVLIPRRTTAVAPHDIVCLVSIWRSGTPAGAGWPPQREWWTT